MIKSKGLFIEGQWIPASGPEFSSTNPATGELFWQGHEATSHEVDLAVQAARESAEDWASLTVEKRAEILMRMSEQLQSSKNELAEAISIETGKPLWESNEEVTSMINKFAISIEAQRHRSAESTQQLPAATSVTRHRPHGVVIVLGPFNLPGHLPNGQIVPALLAGNTVIFKPSEMTPRVAELTMELWHQARLPSGVINLIQGGRDAGRLLAEHSDIDGLFFTGSWNTGLWLSKHFADRPGKILALELGGNNPLVVGSITNPYAAALITIQSAYITAGQRCSCARRLIVPEGDVGDAFIEQLRTLISTIRVGAYLASPSPFMGPVITHAKAMNLLEAQDQLVRSGGQVLSEMKLLKSNTGLLSPGLIDVTSVKNLIDEEYFGPILQLIRTKDLSSAIAEANRTTYGLTAGILSDSQQEYERFFRSIKAGIVNWNMPLTGASSKAPFGGVGRSGNHRPGAYYATDFCSYPVASLENETVVMPASIPPGVG